MEKFERAILNLPPWKEFMQIHKVNFKTFGKVEKEQLSSFYQAQKNAVVYKNNLYTVIVDYNPEEQGDLHIVKGMEGKFIHLSIKRNDKEPIHDWRHLQEIKNQIVGEENEAIEIYPAESRLVDMANQYHLWVFKDQAMKAPIGFKTRGVASKEEAERIGAKQRSRD